MPDQSSNLSSLRSRYFANLYLSDMSGASVFSATADANAADESVVNVAVTAVSGSAANVRAGMRVVVTDSGGDFKGTLTVRHAGTISSTNLPLREFSKGGVQIASGDTLTVYGDLVLVDRLVSADETFAPDQETYSDQGENPPPVCNSGGAWAGWVANAGAIPLVGSASYTTDPDSAGTVTHAWSATSGTIASATDADTTIALASAGKYRVTHVATDSTNSKTATQTIPFRAHDSSDPPYDLTAVTVDGDWQTGFRVTVPLYANTALSTLPDGVYVVLWGDHYYGSTATSFGNTVSGRSHIVCAGYLRRDNARVSAVNDTIEFEIMSPLVRLGELPGFSKVMLRNASPDSWDDIKGLTIKRAIIQIVQYYTNLNNIFDLVFDGFSDADYPAVYLQKASPLGQLNELADSRDSLLTCDHLGRFSVMKRLEYTPLADRSGVTTTFTLTTADVAEIEITRDHWRPLETLRVRGFTEGTDENSVVPAFARYPASPGTGNTSETHERLVVDNDGADIFTRTSLRGAWVNRDYFDSTGQYYHALEVRVTLPIAYAGCFQNYREYVILNLDATTNPRGIDLSVFKFIPMSISASYDERGAGTCTVVMRAASAAPASASVDDTPATETTTDTPPVIIPAFTPPNRGVGGLYPNARILILALSDANLAITLNGNSAYPNWTQYLLTSLGGWLGTGLVDLTVRSDSPLYLGTGTTVNAHIVNNTHALRISDLVSARTLDRVVSLGTTTVSRQMQWERCAPDEGIIISQVSASDPVIADYTDDGGVTWSAGTGLGTGYSTSGLQWIGGLYKSPHTPGLAYTTAMTSTAATPTTENYKTEDGGATWSATNNPNINSQYYTAGAIAAAYLDESTVYFGYRNNTAGTQHRLRRVVGAGSSTDITPFVGGLGYGIDNNRGLRQISIADDDPNSLIMIGITLDDASGKTGVFLTRNARASTPTWEVLVTPSLSVPYRSVYFVNRNAAYLLGLNGAIAFFNGSTIRSLTGDLSTSASGIALAGG